MEILPSYMGNTYHRNPVSRNLVVVTVKAEIWFHQNKKNKLEFSCLKKVLFILFSWRLFDKSMFSPQSVDLLGITAVQTKKIRIVVTTLSQRQMTC